MVDCGKPGRIDLRLIGITGYHARQELLMDTEELSKTIIEFYEKLTTWEEEVVKDSGLTTAQNHAIEIVGHEGAIKMVQLAEKLGVTTGTLTVSIDRLQERDLLRRIPHQTDRRSYLIELTEKGREVFARHHSHHLHLTREMTAELSEQEQLALHQALRKMMLNF